MPNEMYIITQQPKNLMVYRQTVANHEKNLLFVIRSALIAHGQGARLCVSVRSRIL